jgi:hypothetical protein
MEAANAFGDISGLFKAQHPPLPPRSGASWNIDRFLEWHVVIENWSRQMH